MKQCSTSCSKRVLFSLVWTASALARFAYGYLFGFVLWFLLVQPYLSLFNVWTDLYSPEFIFCFLVAIVFMVSIKMREIMILFLPSLAGSASQNYILFLLFSSLAVNPVRHIALNAVESTRVVGCTMMLSYEHLKERAKLLFNPIIEVLSDRNHSDLSPVKADLLHIQHIVSDMRHEAEFNRVLDEVDDKKNRMPHSLPSEEMIASDLSKITQLDSDFSKAVIEKTKELVQDTRVELDKNKLGLKASISVDEIFKLLNDSSPIHLAEFNLTQIMHENCLGVFRQAKKNCQAAVEDMRQSCQDTLGTVFAFVLCSPIKFTVSSLCPWVLDQVIDEKSICREIQETTSKLRLDPFNVSKGADIEILYKNLTQQLTELGGDLFEPTNSTSDFDSVPHTGHRLEINVSFNENVRKTLGAAESFWLFISDKYRWRQLFYSTLTLLYELYTTYTFFSIINHAQAYRKAYLSNIKHDNNYISRQFVELDKYRNEIGRETVLPLTKEESERIIPTLTCKRRTNEERHTQRASCTMIILFLMFILALLYFDNIFYSILFSVQQHSLISFRDLGYHEVDFRVDGEGSVARLIRQLTSRLNSVYRLDRTTNTQDCLPNPIATSSSFYFKFVMLVSFYITIDQVSIYAMRFRRITMAFFHPDREWKRINFLYRAVLNRRRKLRRAGLVDDPDDDARRSPDSVDSQTETTTSFRDALLYLGECITAGIKCQRMRARS